MKTCIIIGASHAGAQLAISLRQGGWEDDIILIGEEPDLPYHRPPLSKDYLSGDKALDDILIRPASVYENANVDLRLNTRISTIDKDEKSITLDNGETLAYDKLVLATGARVRRLVIPGIESDGVYYLRNSQDVRSIKAAIVPGKRAVIIGGGYIGLETAASLRKLGMEVTVIEAMDRILQRVTAPVMSDFYRRVHMEEGVNIVENALVSEITDEDGMQVVTKDGQKFPADMVIVGIGVIPNIELALDAGLETGNGIVVNEFAQTDDPDIYACGDVTWHYNPIYDTHLRLESVPNATEQAKVIANHINEKPKAYNSLPWFWSDQFDLKLQIAGLSQGYDDIIIRGDANAGRSFAAFYFKGDRLLAVDAVNSPREFMFTKMVLTKGQRINKTGLDNPNVELKSLIVS